MIQLHNCVQRAVCLPLLLVLFTACSPAAEPLPTQVVLPTDGPIVQPDPEPPTIEALPEADPVLGTEADGLFTAELAGDLTAQFAASANFTCNGEFHTIASGTTTEGSRIAFELSLPIAVGEYIIDSEALEHFAQLTYQGANFGEETFGVVTIEVAPNTAGDPVSGSYDIGFIGETGQSANATGTFDMIAESVCAP